MGLTQEEILLSLIQGEDGHKWAVNRLGWEESSTEHGKKSFCAAGYVPYSNMYGIQNK